VLGEVIKEIHFDSRRLDLWTIYTEDGMDNVHIELRKISDGGPSGFAKKVERSNKYLHTEGINLRENKSE
jgi:hypothetical protein